MISKKELISELQQREMQLWYSYQTTKTEFGDGSFSGQVAKSRWIEFYNFLTNCGIQIKR